MNLIGRIRGRVEKKDPSPTRAFSNIRVARSAKSRKFHTTCRRAIKPTAKRLRTTLAVSPRERRAIPITTLLRSDETTSGLVIAVGSLVLRRLPVVIFGPDSRQQDSTAVSRRSCLVTDTASRPQQTTAVQYGRVSLSYRFV